MIEHLSYGYITLPIGFLVSMTGSALGLLVARHARRQEEAGRRALWLCLAAFAIGGPGIWTMHFVAMLGFNVVDAELLYSPALTALSALIAVAVVACGLLVIGLGRYSVPKLLVAGPLTGVGVAAMHYTGMAAISADVEMSDETSYMIASVAIAVVATTVALWMAWRLERTVSMWLAAAVMALAVNLMHYTAMMGVRVGGTISEEIHGVHSIELIFPMATLTAIVLLLLIFTVVTVPTAEELRTEERLTAIEHEMGPSTGRAR
ncbi:MHYT domain-containing protein [Glycomyces tenuis]|uniref:MHYT domain-containing protein n=1 Tax=Glycomyces tenuis TaxID=58116 RepID=UPI00040C5650|nr:MHYT domain-containing protein [Glycomyces tenuis]